MQFEPTRAAGLARLAEFLPRAGRIYANERNYDDGTPAQGARRGVSQLSPWLKHGLLSEAEVIDAALAHHSFEQCEKFVSEVFWRVYFKGYLEQRPAIWDAYVKGRNEAWAAKAANSGIATAYNQAIEGRTGIAAFDHWAHELTSTGYLHNHARMWFASIWIFTLKLDWHLGADFFLRHLIDGDAASNTLSWRWVGGLHTKGKTYLARPDNIARYTANQPGGALSATGLADVAEPLVEPAEFGRQTLDLPAADSAAFDTPYALIVHDDGAHHAALNLPRPPALILGAARPGTRSAGAIGPAAEEFAKGAVQSGTADAAGAFGCDSRNWDAGTPLSDILDAANLDRVALPYLTTGWSKDALMPDLAPMMDAGRAAILLPDLDRATWPLAKAGFFGVKKKAEAILAELGINGSGLTGLNSADQSASAP